MGKDEAHCTSMLSSPVKKCIDQGRGEQGRGRGTEGQGQGRGREGQGRGYSSEVGKEEAHCSCMLSLPVKPISQGRGRQGQGQCLQ